MSLTTTIKNIFKPIDLTNGKPWKVILLFWVPILLSYLFQQLYTLIDELIVGHYLANEYVTGIDDTNSLVFLILQFAFGCTAGFSVVSAGKKGENDYDGLRKSFVTQMCLAFFVSIILTVIAIPCVPYLLNTIGMGGASPQTQRASQVFTTTIYAGLFTQFFYNLICAFLRSIGDSLTPFLFLAGSTMLSVGLDFLFIAGIPDMLPTFGLDIVGGKGGGVFGAAMSVNISQFVAAVSCIIYAVWRYKFLRPKLSDFKLSWKFCWEHLKLALPLAFQFSILAIGLIVLQNDIVAFDTFSRGYALSTYNGKPYGEPFKFTPWKVTYSPINDGGVQSYNLAQTAFGPANKFETFLETTLDALGAAMLSYCSQNRGARKYDRIKKGLNQSFVVGAIICTGIAVIELFMTINGAVVHLFTKASYVTPAVIKYAQLYYYFIAPCTYILGVLFIVRSSIQGLGKSFFPLMAGIGELIARILVSIFLPMAIVHVPYTINLFNATNQIIGNTQSIHYGWAYLSVCLASPMAWILAITPCIYGLVHYIYHGNLEKQDLKKFGKDGHII